MKNSAINANYFENKDWNPYKIILDFYIKFTKITKKTMKIQTIV